MGREKNDDDWAESFGVVPCDPEGQWHYETLDEAKKAADGNLKRIWTIVQGDGIDGRDAEWILAGVRIVNRVSYLVSVKEWNDGDINTDYLWYEYGGSEDEVSDG